MIKFISHLIRLLRVYADRQARNTIMHLPSFIRSFVRCRSVRLNSSFSPRCFCINVPIAPVTAAAASAAATAAARIPALLKRTLPFRLLLLLLLRFKRRVLFFILSSLIVKTVCVCLCAKLEESSLR